MSDTVEQTPVDVFDLFADTETLNTLNVKFKGNVWEFKYRNLSWGEKSKILDNAYKIEGDSVRFSASSYILQCLETMIVDSPIHRDERLIFSGMVLAKLDPSVIEQLSQICPSTSVAEEMEEVKKD